MLVCTICFCCFAGQLAAAWRLWSAWVLRHVLSAGIGGFWPSPRMPAAPEQSWWLRVLRSVLKSAPSPAPGRGDCNRVANVPLLRSASPRLSCCRLDIALPDRHVAGARNVWADKFSRGRLEVGFSPGRRLSAERFWPGHGEKDMFKHMENIRAPSHSCAHGQNILLWPNQVCDQLTICGCGRGCLLLPAHPPVILDTCWSCTLCAGFLGAAWVGSTTGPLGKAHAGTRGECCVIP